MLKSCERGNMADINFPLLIDSLTANRPGVEHTNRESNALSTKQTWWFDLTDNVTSHSGQLSLASLLWVGMGDRT